MKFKLILSLLIACTLYAAEFLPPEQAFRASVHNGAMASDFRIDLAPKIYLYVDKIHAIHNGQDITADLELPEGALHDGERVLYEYLYFQLPKFAASGSLELDFQGCSEDGLCYQPMRSIFRAQDGQWQHASTELISQANQETSSDEGRFIRALESGNFITALLLFAGFGVLLSLTPCTLPMLPILSGILARKSGSNALAASIFYVIGMALAYAIAGVGAALAGGSFAAILQQPSVQLAFAALFVLLAASSFGLFELQLPRSLQRAASSSERAGGLLGAFIMGVLSALLVGPCVAAPLAGALVYIASSGDVLLGGAALFVMALGMGVPLVALGAGFSLIKSGAWMVQINRFFGFVLLAVAVFFASSALPQVLSFVFYALILSAFAADFRLLERAKSAKGWLAKALVMLILLAGYVSLYKVYARAWVPAQTVEFHELKSDEDFHINKPSLLYFTADWCENCEIYHNEIFPQLSSELEQFDLLKIDLTKPNEFERKMAKDFQVFGPPVIVIFDAAGKQIDKITGLESEQNLRKILKISQH